MSGIDPAAATVKLQNVRSYGTEGRRPQSEAIPGSSEVFEFIVFSGNDIKDLQVAEAPAKVATDPAVLSFQKVCVPL